MTPMHTHPVMTRRRLLGCCAAAAAGLFTSLPLRAADPLPAGPAADLRDEVLSGLDAHALWDVHAHLLGVGDAGSGCRIHPHMVQGWHPLERLRKQVILRGAGVAEDAPSIDRAYVQRLRALADGFPPGARWLLYAFDQAHDDAGRAQPEWSTFQVPDAYAAEVAAAHPDRFSWVASIHPYRADALPAMEHALAQGALAIKWLPGAMNIDLRDARLAPFYDRLAATRLPLVVHCGEEKAVPGAGRHDLGNPLHLRAPLARGVRVIAAHCASLGDALDLDARRPGKVPAFDLFARLMDERAHGDRLLGDVSALFQVNRRAAVWQTVLQRQDWHARLLHGSDHPLPGVAWLQRPAALVRAGLLAEAELPRLEALRAVNPLLFDLAVKRLARWRAQGLGEEVFHTARHFGSDTRGDDNQPAPRRDVQRKE